MCGLHERRAGQLLDLRLRQRGFHPIDPAQVPCTGNLAALS